MVGWYAVTSTPAVVFPVTRSNPVAPVIRATNGVDVAVTCWDAWNPPQLPSTRAPLLT